MRFWEGCAATNGRGTTSIYFHRQVRLVLLCDAMVDVADDARMLDLGQCASLAHEALDGIRGADDV